MPKELNVSPNQRIDLEDFEYGTRTFTIDSLRAHVTRLMAGGYRGGFVLEGFRVEISSTLTDMFVNVTNGIALDRTGRLVTFEEGDYFLNNPLATKNINLLEASPTNYLMIEYTLANVDPQERAFWDPTYPAAPVTDSGGDTVPMPKGKEFDLSVVTRKAQSWTPVISSTGFEDATDPNKIRIPVAIIPIDTGGPSVNLVNGTDTKYPTTSIAEKPRSRQETAPWTPLPIQYIQCADTRMFASTGFIEVKKSDGVTNRTFWNGVSDVTLVRYTNNDRTNNRLYLEGGMTVPSGNDADGFPYEEPEITDIVFQAASGGDTPLYYLKEASKYDCRPMFFAMTEAEGGRQENVNDWPINVDGERRNDSRQFKYWSGLALLTDPFPTVTGQMYPLTQIPAGIGQQKLYMPPPTRLETRIKQNQDFFRVIASVVEEMKYGVAKVDKGSWTENENATGGYLTDLGITVPTIGTGKYLIDGLSTFSQEYVGATVSIISATIPANVGKRLTVKKVYGDNVIEFETTTGSAFSSGDQYEIELNFPGTRTGFADGYQIGSLQEVFDGRLDDFTGTYTPYLSSRLTANKVATITVGDGVSTFGDYTGSVGLFSAFKQAYEFGRETLIYVKSGIYEFNSAYDGYGPIFVGPNTKVVGDGIDETIISFTGNTVTVSNYFRLADYNENYLREGAATYRGELSGVRVAGVEFKDLTIRQEQHHPVISNMTLERMSDVSTAITGAGALTDGVMAPVFSELNSAGVLKDSIASLVEDLRFTRVKITGGGYGFYTAQNAGISFYGEPYVANNQAIDKSATYAINIFGATRHLTNYSNMGIHFTECEFVNKGGVGFFDKTAGAAFRGCKFYSTDVFDYGDTSAISQWGVEGITFASTQNGPASAAIPPAEIGWQGSNIVGYSRDVSIDSCSFIGVLAESNITFQSVAFKRGWINFTPSYAGPLASISNCAFLMDTLGTAVQNSPYPSQLGYFGGDNSVTGGTHACIYKGSSTPLDINNCQFFAAYDGIVTQMGDTSIRGCSFYNVHYGVHVNGMRSYDTGYTPGLRGCTSFYRGYGAYYQDTNFSTTVSDCKFVGRGTDFLELDWCVGIKVDGVDRSYAQSRSRLEVKGCSFAEMNTGAQLWLRYDTGVATGTVPETFSTDGYTNNVEHRPRWDHIAFSESSFTRMKNVITYAGQGAHAPGINNANRWQTSAADDIDYSLVLFWINNFDFIGNNLSDFTAAPALTHIKGSYTSVTGATPYPGAAALYHAAYVNIFAKHVRARDNTFEDILPTTRVGYGVKDHLSLFGIGFGFDLEIIGNSISEFYEDTGKTVIADIYQCAGKEGEGGYGVLDKAKMIKICDNHYTSDRLDWTLTGITDATTNGFWIGVISRNYTKTTIVDDPNALVCSLKFSNNVLELHNTNFGVVADQQYGLTTVDDGSGVGTIGGNMTITGSDQVWEWGSAEIRNNRIINNQYWSGATPTTNLQYGNDIGNACELVGNIVDPEANVTATYFTGAGAKDGNMLSYLGAANGAGNMPAKYSALIDLRCFQGNLSQTSPSGGDPLTGVNIIFADSCVVTGNVLHVTDLAGTGQDVWPIEDEPEIREEMGIRISKFPTLMDITDNEFVNAPLILEWKYKNPYIYSGGSGLIFRNHRRSELRSGGFSCKINNNQIVSHNRWHSVLVDSAVGYPVRNDTTGTLISVDNVTQCYVNLQLQNNTFRAANDSCGIGSPAHIQANYDLQFNRVSLWHPTVASYGYGTGTQNWPVGANGPFPDMWTPNHTSVMQRWGRYLWMITENTFYNCFTFICESFDGGVSTTPDTELATNGFFSTTTANGYYQFANFINNYYVFVSTSYPIVTSFRPNILGLFKNTQYYDSESSAGVTTHRGSAKGNQALVNGTNYQVNGAAEGTYLEQP